MINERLKELDPDFDENSYFNQMMQKLSLVVF